MNNKILYEDENVVAVAKLPGQLVVPGRFSGEAEVISDFLLERTRESMAVESPEPGEIFPLLRLDKEVSGVVLFAKTKAAHKTCNRMIQDNQIIRTFWGVIVEQDDWDVINVHLPIKRTETKSERGRARIDFRSGRSAHSEFRVIDQGAGLQLLEIQAHTLALHQIRLHLRAIGAPLVFDAKYGFNRESAIDFTPLHARSLQFESPFDGQQINVTAAIPENMRELVDRIKKSK